MFIGAGAGILSACACGLIKDGTAMGTEESRKPWREGEEDDKPGQEGGKAGGSSARIS